MKTCKTCPKLVKNNFHFCYECKDKQDNQCQGFVDEDSPEVTTTPTAEYQSSQFRNACGTAYGLTISKTQELVCVNVVKEKPSRWAISTRGTLSQKSTAALLVWTI
jgi:hypothetical protein